MENLTNWVNSNGAVLIGAAAILCGVALMSLVMGRTSKHHSEQSEPQDG